MPTYSFANVSATLAGPLGIVSLGNGAAVAEEGITIEPAEDKNTMTLGADGSVMHSLHAGNPANCSIRLLKTSPQNAVLERMLDGQTLNSTSWGNNVITINDPVRGDIATLRQVAFRRRPVVVYAKVGNINEWQFHVGQITQILGSGD